jgi:monoamine oxidase
VRCDVVIIGAGISGLACAAGLSQHAISAVILEARDIIGGRIRTYRPPDGGPALELGAQVIHGDRNPLRDLAKHGICGTEFPESQPVSRSAAAWAVLNGRVTPLGALARGGVPPWDVESRLTASDGGPPPGGSHGQERDGHGDVPVAAWLAEQGLTGDHLLAAAEWFRQNWAADPAALSARGVAAARRGDSSGDGEYAFSHGYLELIETLAAGRDIRLRSAVRTVAWSPGHAELTTSDGTRITARAVVITAPPPVVAGELAITPMPERKAAAGRALPSGDGLCAVVTLSHAADETAVVFDADGQGGFGRCLAGRPEVLIVAKAGAAAAVRAADPARLVSRMFPRWAAPHVIGVQMADWGRDPWSAGAFSYPMVGAGWAGRAWAAPVQRTLFFAGDATTAGSLPPTAHAALGSGLRAASDIVEAWGS